MAGTKKEVNHGAVEIAEGGFSWYVNVFSMTPTLYTGGLQMGVGTWLAPTPIEFSAGSQCACDPKGYPSARPKDGRANCCDWDPSNGKRKCADMYQTFEGGSGHWGNGACELPTTVAKWRMNSAVGCYVGENALEMSSHLFEFGGREGVAMACSKLALVQLSNRMLIPPDGLTVDKEGLLGTGFLRAPFGETSDGDKRNFWTLVLDAANFGGPVAYVLPEYFATRAYDTSNYPWETPLADFGTPDIKMVMPAISMEWQGMPNWQTMLASGNHQYKIPKLRFPQAKGPTVLAADAIGWSDSEFYDILNAWLGRDGSSNLTEADVGRMLLRKNGTVYNCTAMSEPAKIKLGTSDNQMYQIGVLRTEWDLDDTDRECVWDITVDNNDGATPQYFDEDVAEPVPAAQTPSSLVESEFPTKPPCSDYSGSPSGGCTTSPEASELYCVKTNSPSWVTFKWYEFTEQPALQRLGLTQKEKDYLQTKVERLHRSDTAHEHWIKPGKVATKYGLAEIQASLILTPPKEYKHGSVPVALGEFKEKPQDCTEPIQGEAAPADYRQRR